MKGVATLRYLAAGESYWENSCALVIFLGIVQRAVVATGPLENCLHCGAPTVSHLQYFRDLISILSIVSLLQIHKKNKEIFLEAIN